MRPLLAVMALVLAGDALASAQTVEITPVVGYRFGGSFALAGAPTGLEVKDSGAFGVHVGVKVAEDGEIEALYARQDTRLDSGGFFTSEPLFDVTIDTYQLGGSYLFRDENARVRPYISLGLGVTRFVPAPADLEAETRFSASFAGGLRAYVARNFGFRLEVRGFFTVLNSDSAIFCNSATGCLIRTTGSELSQGEIRAGLIFRF
jgi:hypothetical protein